MVAEDVGAKRKIEQLLSDRDETLQEVKQTLQGMYFLLFFFVEIRLFFIFFCKKNLFAGPKKKFFLFCFGAFFSLCFSPR